MSDLVSQDGKLVVRDGKLGTGQACCCGCCQKIYFVDCLFEGANAGDRAVLNTITIPSRISLPAKIRMVGTVDDVLLKDGEPWPPGTAEDAAAYSFDYTWTEENRSFTIEVLDTEFVNIGLIDTYIYITCEGGDFSEPDCDPDNSPEELPCGDPPPPPPPPESGACWIDGVCFPYDSAEECEAEGGLFCAGEECGEEPCNPLP